MGIRTIKGKVYFCQFLKPPTKIYDHNKYSNNITLEQLSSPWSLNNSLNNNKLIKQSINKKLLQIKNIAQQGQYDLIILDEIIFCLYKKLAQWNHILSIIKTKKEWVELILTGRYATKKLLKKADLVTEMKEIKHPLQKGILARKGIEF